MHKLDRAQAMSFTFSKEDPRFQIFGWDFVGYSSENIGTKKEIDYGYDPLYRSVVSREREQSIDINYAHYYRILEEDIRDEIIRLEEEYNDKIINYQYKGKFVSWFFYFIKTFIPIVLGSMIFIAYIPMIIIGMNTDKNLIDNNNDDLLTILIMVGFLIGILITSILTNRESKKANLLKSIALLKKHRDFKEIIKKAEDLLKKNNNNIIEFDPNDEIIFNKNFLNMNAFKRKDKGLIIPKGVSEVLTLSLDPEQFLYVYIPKDVETFPYIWFKNKASSNYYQDGTQKYTTYKNRYVIYEGSEADYGYPSEVEDIYRYYFNISNEELHKIIIRISIDI